MPPRTKRIKPRNAKRAKKNDQRATGGKKRRDFVASLPCIVCNAVPSEGAHIVTGGMGRKADKEFVAPICFMHHQGGTDSLHKMGPGPGSVPN